MRVLTAIITLMVVTIGCARSEDHPGPIYEKVLPGSPDLQLSRFTSHKARYSKPGGTMTLDLHHAIFDGRDSHEIKIWFNVQEGDGKPDTIIFDVKTLGFSSRNFGGSEYEIDVRFKDGRFIGNLMPGEGSRYNPVKYDKAYPHNAFEPSVIHYFVAALPLREGYTASIPIFDLNSGSQMLWANIEVLGRETITVDGKAYDTWKVFSDGARKKTLWISDNEPFAIQFQTQGAPGIWKLAEFEKSE